MPCNITSYVTLSKVSCYVSSAALSIKIKTEKVNTLNFQEDSMSYYFVSMLRIVITMVDVLCVKGEANGH